MGISYRSSYNASGGDVNLDSFYVICGDKKWLRGQTINNADLTTNVVIGDNYCNARYLLSAKDYNYPIYVGNNVSDSYLMLPQTYNSYVTLGNNLKSCSRMFENRYNFNKPITIPDSVTDCYCMFYRANEFNQPITIPNSAINCEGMFAACYNFNQPITVPENVNSCEQMFIHANNFNSPVTFGSNVNRYWSAFYNCFNFNTDVYIKSLNTSIYAVDMFLNAGGAKIHFDPSMNSVFNSNKPYGLSEITWTDMSDGNGFYNSAYNIYCYNNYVV